MTGKQIKEAVTVWGKYNLHKPVSNHLSTVHIQDIEKTNGVLDYC
ncbi:MAG: hypothetical protein R3A12_00415 [Ignavibacteria bacterium]